MYDEEHVGKDREVVLPQQNLVSALRNPIAMERKLTVLKNPFDTSGPAATMLSMSSTQILSE